MNLSEDPHSKPKQARPPFSFRTLIDQAKSSDFFIKITRTLSTRIFLIIIGFTSSVIIARALGPEGRGMFAIAVAIGALAVQFTNLGLHGANTYYVSRDPQLLPSLLGNSLTASFSLGTLISLLAGLFFWIYPSLAPIHGTLLLMALAWAPLGLAYLLLQSLLLGVDDIRTYNTIELVTKLFYFRPFGGHRFYQSNYTRSCFWGIAGRAGHKIRLVLSQFKSETTSCGKTAPSIYSKRACDTGSNRTLDPYSAFFYSGSIYS